MKRIIVLALVLAFVSVAPCFAKDPNKIRILQTATVAFNTSSGATSFASAIDLTNAMCLAVVAVGDDIFCTFDDGTTTPVKDQHIPITQGPPWTFLLPVEAEKGYFTGGGSSSGYVNLITYDSWAEPY